MTFIHLKWTVDHSHDVRWSECIRELQPHELKALERTMRHFQAQADEVNIITELPGWYFAEVLAGKPTSILSLDPWVRKNKNA